MFPPNVPPRSVRSLSRPGCGKFKQPLQKETAALPWGRRRNLASNVGSAIAEAVRGAFPLRHIIGDHARGLHGGLAELGIAGNLALDALTFGMQQVAQALEFRNQIFDFRERGSGDALDQRVDVIDGGLGVRLQRRLGAAQDARRRAAPIGAVAAARFSSSSIESIFSGRMTFITQYPCYALTSAATPAP